MSHKYTNWVFDSNLSLLLSVCVARCSRILMSHACYAPLQYPRITQRPNPKNYILTHAAWRIPQTDSLLNYTLASPATRYHYQHPSLPPQSPTPYLQRPNLLPPLLPPKLLNSVFRRPLTTIRRPIKVSIGNFLVVPCPAELALAGAYSLVVCAVCAFASPVCGCLACEEVFEPGEHFCGGCVVGSWGGCGCLFWLFRACE